MATKVDLISSPFNDREFIYVNNDIILYKIVPLDEYYKLHPSSSLDQFPCDIVSRIIKYQSSNKTVSWYPGQGNEHLISLHESNSNKIRLFSISNYNSSTNLETSLDLDKPRNSGILQWNQSKYLASGFESLTSMKSIFIWDISQQNSKPIFELDEVESCNSIAWHPDNPEILYTGIVYQYVSLFDIRKGVKCVESINTEFIHGFSIDVKDPKFAASYFENKIAFWDLRKFQEPIGFSEFQMKIRKIQFSPSSKNRLTVLCEKAAELDYLKILTIDDNTTVEPVYYNRRGHNENCINSFCWLKKESDLVLTIDSKNSIKSINMSDYVALNFSTDNLVTVSSNDINKENINKFEINKKNDQNLQIDERMKERAMNNYGVQEFLNNAELIENENKNKFDVVYLWRWLDLSNKLCEKAEKFNGIRAIIHAGKENESITFSNFIENNRNFMLKLCGWGQWEELVNQLKDTEDFERAACISIFHNDFDKAVDILTLASKINKSNEYLALSIILRHFKKRDLLDNNEEFISIVNKLTNSYLKVLFLKLSHSLNSFNYYETDILIPDRIAFAILTLGPEKLVEFVDKLTKYCIEQGNLFGILLTGLNLECLDLFQSYITRSYDVQTAAVAIINSNLENDNSIMWIETYRGLLDQWMMWEQRALFDIYQNSRDNNLIKNQPKPQVHVKCSYCGENISTKGKKK